MFVNFPEKMLCLSVVYFCETGACFPKALKYAWFAPFLFWEFTKINDLQRIVHEIKLRCSLKSPLRLQTVAR